MTSTFRRFLAAYGFDRAGDIAWTVALSWIAAQNAPSRVAQGALLAAAFVPNLLFLLIGGDASDRLGPGRVTRFTSLFKAAVLFGWLIAFTVSPSLWIVGVAGALMGVLEGFHDPAIDSYGPRLVSRDDLARATGQEQIMWRVAQAAGAAVAGALLTAGPREAVAGAAVLIAAGWLGLLTVRGEHPQNGMQGPDTGESSNDVGLRPGLAFLGAHPSIPYILPVQAAMTIGVAACLSFLFPTLTHDRHWHPVIYGAAAAMFSVAMAVGIGAVVRDRDRSPAHRRLRGSPATWGLRFSLMSAIPLLMIAALPHPATLICGAGLLGCFIGPGGYLLVLHRRSEAPPTLLGVVTAAGRLVSSGPEPLGPLLAGVLTSFMDIRWALVVMAAVLVATGGSAMLALRGRPLSVRTTPAEGAADQPR